MGLNVIFHMANIVHTFIGIKWLATSALSLIRLMMIIAGGGESKVEGG